MGVKARSKTARLPLPARCVVCKGELGVKWIQTILGIGWCLPCDAVIEEHTTASLDEADEDHKVRGRIDGSLYSRLTALG